MGPEQLEQFEELARRAVACKHWRWMPGMRGSWRGLDGYWFRVVRVQGSVVQCYDETSWSWENADTNIKPDDLPDLSDPATMGCLLALVREAHNAPAAYLMGSVSQQWVVHHFAEPEGYWKPLTKWQRTEAEALVAALEVAP